MRNNPDPEVQAFRAICRELGERRHDTRHQIALLSKAHGLAWAHELVEEAKKIQLGPGMRTVDGVPRTLGGIFFVLARQRLGDQAFRSTVLRSYTREKMRRERRQAKAEAAAAAHAAAQDSPAEDAAEDDDESDVEPPRIARAPERTSRSA